MGTDVIVSPERANIHMRAMLRQLRETDVACGYDSLVEALNELGLWEFLENQANVVAALHAFELRDNNIIRDLIHNQGNQHD